MSTSIYSISKELERAYFEEKIQDEKNNNGIMDEEAERDRFRKRITRIIKAFKEDVTKLNIENSKSPNSKLPKPSLDILQYEKRECVYFLKSYLEESDCMYEENGKITSSRKAKYLYDRNVNLDKKYDFIYRVLQHNFVKPADFSIINHNFNTEYNEIRSWIREKAKEDFWGNNKYILPRTKLYLKYEAMLNDGKYNYFRYVIILAIIWLNICRGTKEDKLLTYAPWGEKGKFRILWKLWMWIWIQTVQYLVLEEIEKIDENDLHKLKNKMNSLEQDVNRKMDSMNKSDEIFKGYFMYNFLLMVRDETIKDAEFHQSFISKEWNTHYTLPDELCFVGENNEPKEWCSKIDKATKQKYFDFRSKKYSAQTFKDQLSFCNEFISAYNNKAGRELNPNDLKTQRAVYRAFYIDKIKINRRELATIAKDIINRDNYEGIFTEHFLLGNVISDELITEYYQGERVLKIKNEAILLIYSIGLKIFYRYCPCLEENKEEFQNALNNLEFYFIETVNAIYESFHK